MGGGGGGSVACALWRWASGPEEQRLLELLAYGLVALGAGAALLLRFVPMPYGRYSTRRFGPLLLPARPAWALQELPSLLVPLGLAACGGAATGAWPNRLLLGCFVVHYAHRCGPPARGGELRAGALGWVPACPPARLRVLRKARGAGRRGAALRGGSGSVWVETPGRSFLTAGVEVPLLIDFNYLR